MKGHEYGKKSTLKKIAAGGDCRALCELAELYFKGAGGCEQLPEKTLKLFEKAAEKNYPSALYRLGEFYYFGKVPSL